MTIISKNQTIFELTEQHPDVANAMVLLGLDGVLNPMLRNTVGRQMTIAKGTTMRQIPWEQVVEAFAKYGFEFAQE